MARIALVDDHPGYRRVLRLGLSKEGYDVVEAGDGNEALRLVRTEKPDLVLLDFDLPGLLGTTVCRLLKQDSATETIPILMVTGRDAEEDRIAGFEAGADDYLVKPFSVRELFLRMRVLLRRESAGAGRTITLGTLKMDLEAHHAWVDGIRTQLTVLEFAVLRALCERTARVVTRDELLDSVWGLEHDFDARIVDGHVRRLREKLGSAGHYINTVRGAGYRIDGP